MAGHCLRLLGEATLEVEGKAPVRLERRAAGVLAYLALEGPTPRSRLAGLLWPQTPERAARNNLVQALRRLRQATGGYEVAGGDEVLKLAEGLEADAARLVLLAFQGRYAEALALEGELLTGHDYDDCPDFADWLLAEREHLAGLRREALQAEAERLLQEGELRGALALALRLQEADPFSEEHLRRVMRLYYLLGDRGAALVAYHQGQAWLRRELGVDPLPETQALAREIERGAILPAQSPPARREIPLSLLRPPVLSGREREWALLEEAWESGKAIFISGEPGVGKSRLMLDFAASRGRSLLVEARPGDAGVPFSTYARGLEQALREHPALSLKGWVRRELSRLLPALAEEPPPPLRAAEDKLRLLEALGEVVRLLREAGVVALVLDDLQYMDPASLEAAIHLIQRPTGAFPRLIGSFRGGELPSEALATVQRLVEAGLAVRIGLEPLTPQAVGHLLQTLDLPGLDAARLAPLLSRYTGGNPLFVLETLRTLWESGGLQGTPERFPAPRRVKELIARRLQALSPAASRLVRAAAIAGEDLALGLAAGVLQSNPLDLAEPWAELEAAQILREGRFAHDLLRETVLEGIPAPIQAHLHHQVALALEEAGAHPARIAQHWLLAGQEEAAARSWLAAGRDYQARALYAEALAMLEKALAYGQEEAMRAEARLLMADIYREQRRYCEAEALLETLLEGPTPLRVRVEALRTRTYLAIGDHPKAVRYAQEAYLLAQELGDEELTHLTLTAYAAALWGVGRAAEAARLLEPELARDHPDPRHRIRAFAYLGALHAHRGRFAEAYPLLEEAHRLALGQDPYWQVLATAFLVGADVERGEPLAHRELAQAARALGPFDVSEYLALVLVRAYLEAQEPQAALELLEERPGERLGPACATWGLLPRTSGRLSGWVRTTATSAPWTPTGWPWPPSRRCTRRTGS
ncbi:ATP-binding protein [Meiothermus rufus]|uniref:ATP-binding protein n=1 Tax=Meiothermus rufus TaxID=604332 RepID=UPI0004268FE7|nr:AAA family ATPase [Meiothermus rufus]